MGAGGSANTGEFNKILDKAKSMTQAERDASVANGDGTFATSDGGRSWLSLETQRARDEEAAAGKWNPAGQADAAITGAPKAPGLVDPSDEHIRKANRYVRMRLQGMGGIGSTFLTGAQGQASGRYAGALGQNDAVGGLKVKGIN